MKSKINQYIVVLLLPLMLSQVMTQAQTTVAPLSVNTDWIGQIGNEQAALTVRGPVVIGAYGFDLNNDGDYDDDDDNRFDALRTTKLEVGQDGRMGEILLWVERGVVGSVVFVDISEWGDYVFDKDYALRPLNEVKSFIEINHHLPEVPSASTIKSMGYSAKEMNKTMIVKIEELTLYTLEQQKKIEALQNKVNKKRQFYTAAKEEIVGLKEQLGLPVEADTDRFATQSSSTSSTRARTVSFAADDIEASMSAVSPETVENDLIHETTYAGKVGANTNHVEEEGTVFNIKGKTMIVPMNAIELPDLSWYVIDENDPEQEAYDFSLFIDGYFVAGDVVTRNLGEWADYVFKADYSLNSLDEVRDFIKRNGHLPELPSAAELYKNGYRDIEMKGKFLAKIEELFLYQITQQKEIEALSSTLHYLESEGLKELKTELNALKKNVSNLHSED